MYGLVNRAIQEFVSTNYGTPTWDVIKRTAKVEAVDFHGMEEYPDCVTFALVGAASQELKMPAEQVLEAFGEYWVLYTAKEGYGDLLKMSGADFVAFLQNLDLLHARIGRAYPSLKPPAFQCSDITDRSLLLHYRSERDGLVPLVLGLIKGLGRMFQTTVQIVPVEQKSEGADHDVFRVDFEPAR